MKYKHKQMMVKGSILINTIWLCIVIVVLLRIEFGYNLPFPFSTVVVIIIIIYCTTAVMSILYFKIGIDDPLVKSKKKKIIAKSFIPLQNSLEEELHIKGFEKVEEFREDNYYMEFYLKKVFDRVYIFVLVNTEVLKQPIYNGSITRINNYLTDNTKFVRLKEFYLIHCICVQKASLEFYQLVDTNLDQDLDLFELPVGILFEESIAYIATQKGGFAITKYKHLRKLFLKLMKNQWDT